MIESIPPFVGILFTLTTLYGLWWFKKCFKPGQATWILLFAWFALQGYLAYTGFYQDNQSIPPHFALAIVPPLILIIYLLVSKRNNFSEVELSDLHWIHTIRIPVEVVLWLLYTYEQIPKIMTFEGRNFDILMGLTAPLVVLYGFRKKLLDKQRIILWNLIGLVLLANIVITAVLSVASPFQQLAFDMPNQAVLAFPYVWLPSFIVPLVIFSHLLSLKKLLAN